MSFLKIGDRAAGAIKSGGTTRRAAKMVVVDVDHPDIEAYIDWKVKEEQKVAALAAGSKVVKRHLKAIFQACVNCEGSGDDCFNVDMNPALKREVKAARKNDVPDGIIKPHHPVRPPGLCAARIRHLRHRLGVGGLSHRLRAELQQFGARDRRVPAGGRERRRLEVSSAASTARPAKTLKARDLWDKIGYAAWASADPGVQYHTTINDWHTCPESGPIRASNPCSEYMFLDDTACNLASLNLLQFRDAATKAFDVKRLRARDPALDADARNLGRDGAIPVARDRAAVVRLPHARPRLRQYRRAADVLGHPLRQRRGPGDLRRADRDPDRPRLCDLGRDRRQERGLPGPSSAMREAMLRVIRNHKRAADGDAGAYEKLSVAPTPLDHAELAKAGPDWADLSEAARAAWGDALALGEKHGYRNAQVSVIAPTGTIGLVMDCDTTGIEPDFALVKFKKLAGGGYFKIINRAVPEALRALGYDERQIADIVAYAVGRATLAHAPGVNHAALQRQGPAGGGDRQGRGGAARARSTSASSSTNGRLGPRRLRRRSRSRPSAMTRRASISSPRLASPRPRSRPRTASPAAR